MQYGGGGHHFVKVFRKIPVFFKGWLPLETKYEFSPSPTGGPCGPGGPGRLVTFTSHDHYPWSLPLNTIPDHYPWSLPMITTPDYYHLNTNSEHYPWTLLFSLIPVFWFKFPFRPVPSLFICSVFIAELSWVYRCLVCICLFAYLMLQWGYIGRIGSISASSFASCIILLSLTISHPTLFPPIFFSAHNNSFWKTDTFMCNRCEQIFSTNVCIKVQDGSGYTQFRYICPLHAYFACLPPSEHIKTFHTWIRQSHWSLINVQISYIFANIW